MPRLQRLDNQASDAATRRHRAPRRALATVLITLTAVLPSRILLAEGSAERGASLFAMAGGCGCHTGPDGPIGAGGGIVPTPFGTFYGTNITADKETGIGAWTDEQIMAAIRTGWLPDGSAESPAMPYYRYAGMTDTDLSDLIAYVRTIPAVRRENTPHDVGLPFSRLAYRAWRLLFFSPPDRAVTTADTAVARGRYLVDHVAICGDCHTPRTRFGSSDDSLYLAGTDDGPDGVTVPNITPSRTGLHDWTAASIVTLLKLAMLPNFDNVQGLMAEVVEGKAGGPGYKDAPPADLAAIAAYLKSVPPIDHAVGR